MEQMRIANKTVTLWLPEGACASSAADVLCAELTRFGSAYDPALSSVRHGELPTGTRPAKPALPHALPLVYLNHYDGDGREVWEACDRLGCPAFALTVISGLDWNHELSPWECDGTVRDAEPFAGGAATYLDELLGEIVPAVEHRLPAAPAWRGIAGYSLAGLFALWSLWRTSAFTRAASASGSLWFPGFVERAGEEPFAGSVEAAYLSLGKKETRTPNRMMRHVLEDTQRMEELLCSRDIPCTFELNPGNHFSQTDERMARGIAWILKA